MFGYAGQTEVDETALVEDVSEALGDVDADTGWVPMPADCACTGASEYRSLLWDDIRYVLARREGPAGLTYLAGWTIGDTALAFSPPLDAEITEASGITTDDGIGLGTSADRLDNLDWDQSWRQGDRFLGLAGLGWCAAPAQAEHPIFTRPWPHGLHVRRRSAPGSMRRQPVPWSSIGVTELGQPFDHAEAELLALHGFGCLTG